MYAPAISETALDARTEHHSKGRYDLSLCLSLDLLCGKPEINIIAVVVNASYNHILCSLTNTSIVYLLIHIHTRIMSPFFMLGVMISWTHSSIGPRFRLCRLKRSSWQFVYPKSSGRETWLRPDNSCECRLALTKTLQISFVFCTYPACYDPCGIEFSWTRFVLEMLIR